MPVVNELPLNAAARMNDQSSEYVRSNELLSRGNSRLLIVDVQEKLVPLIPVADSLIGNCRRLIEGAQILNVPVFATEQYPKGLGKTVGQLANLLGKIPSKQRFSCGEVLDWGMAAADEEGRDKVVVAGMETHVCVQHTVLDLISCGFRVYVPADAVASRHKLDWKIALDRLSAGGATVTTTESVLFEWCETSANDQFKKISRLITGTSAND
jgi:nicotinamidase-related amidase